MQAGDFVKYIGRNGDAHYGIVIEVDSRTYGPVRALLHCANYSMWFGPGTLEVVSESR